MAILALLLLIVFWLALFWAGSILLEAAGLERSKARFQALSALTRTGYTTQESELVVNQPRRRRIAGMLMLSGQLSVPFLVVLAVLYGIYGIHAPVWQIAVFAGTVLLLPVLVHAGVLDRLTSRIMSSLKTRQDSPYSLAGGILHEKNEYGVVRVWLSSQAKAINMTIRDTGFDRSGITVLAIERRERVISFPDSSEFLQPGDYILCYGRMAEITRAAGVNQ